MKSKELFCTDVNKNLCDNLKGFVDQLGIAWTTDLIWHYQVNKILDSNQEQHWIFERDSKSEGRVKITCKMNRSPELLHKHMQSMLIKI